MYSRFAAIILAIQMTVAAMAQKVETGDLAVDVSIKDTNLAISLASKRSGTVAVASTALPWENWDSIALVLVKARNNEVLRIPVVPLEGVGARQNLRPGEEVKGVISLAERFPHLSEALRESDVIVFWSFKTRFRGGAGNGRTARSF